VVSEVLILTTDHDFPELISGISVGSVAEGVTRTVSRNFLHELSRFFAGENVRPLPFVAS
jgi:hypothetical protein